MVLFRNAGERSGQSLSGSLRVHLNMAYTAQRRHSQAHDAAVISSVIDRLEFIWMYTRWSRELVRHTRNM